MSVLRGKSSGKLVLHLEHKIASILTAGFLCVALGFTALEKLW